MQHRAALSRTTTPGASLDDVLMDEKWETMTAIWFTQGTVSLFTI
ncbi:hypothetical protein [Nonomuraea aurantiaca]|jgi:general stress protein 26|nr:hypothetical protein [Nonomuraea aurantiaca]